MGFSWDHKLVAFQVNSNIIFSENCQDDFKFIWKVKCARLDKTFLKKDNEDLTQIHIRTIKPEYLEQGGLRIGLDRLVEQTINRMQK